MKKLYAFLFLLFLLFVGSTGSYSQCLLGWNYKIPVDVSNPNPGALTNYQVKLTVNTAALVSAGHMQASGNDIRFTQGGCCNFLPHTIESGMNTASTIIWVKVGSIPAAGNATIDLNYGNLSAVSADNPSATFDLWEPFDNSVNHFSAACGSGTYTVASGAADISWPSSNIVSSDITFDMDTVYTGEMMVNSASGNWPGINFSGATPGSNFGYSMLLGSGVRIGKAGSSAPDYCRGENWASTVFSTPGSVTGLWSITWIATGNIIGDFPGLGLLTSTDTEHSRSQDMKLCLGGISGGTGAMNIDWVRVRKYVAIVPTFSFGSESPLSFQTVSIGNDTTVCDISGGLLMDAGAGFSSYTWSGTASGSAQTATVNAVGQVIIHATDASSCPSSDTILVTEFSPINLNIGVDQIICLEDTTTLDAGAGFTNYVWSSGGTNQLESVSAAGNYIATVTDVNGCTDSDTLVVTEFSPINLNIGVDQFICSGDTATLDAGSGFTNYAWSSGGTNQFELVSTAGNFIATVTDGNGCSDADTIGVSFYPQPTSSFSFSSTSLATTFTNTSTGGVSYLWDFGDGNTSTNVDTVHVFAVSGTYNVCLTVTNSNNCETTTCTSVTVANTGVHENMAAAGITLYPNPATNTIWLNSITQLETVQVGIVDMLGKMVFVRSYPSLTQQSIDITALDPGNYVIQISSGGKIYYTSLVVAK